MADELILRRLDEESANKHKRESARVHKKVLPAFNRIDIFFVLLSIGSYLLDTGTDLALVYFYYSSGDVWYFGLTLGFVIVPAVTMTIVSLYWYVDEQITKESPPVSIGRWIFRAVFLLLQLGTVLRYIDSLDWGWKSLKKSDRQIYLLLWAYEDADATLLRLFECFMEAAPQLILQLNIMIRNAQSISTDPMFENSSSVNMNTSAINITESVTEFGQDKILLHENSVGAILLQVVSVIASLVSVCWALASYHQAERYSQLKKQNISVIGLALYFLWRVGTVGARVLALALFASLFPMWLAVFCGIHWIMMSTYFLWEKTNVCSNRVAEIGFVCIAGFINIFCFFKIKDERTRYKYAAFYTWEFCENTALIITWFLYTDPTVWFYYVAIIGHYFAFFFGLCIMILYYTSFHPSMGIAHCTAST